MFRLLLSHLQAIYIVLRQNLEAIPGEHSTDSQHKTAILGTSNIIPKVLLSET
jgi:hypothetical protein